MGKSGSPSTVRAGGGSRSAETRRLLVEAAIATLKEDGYAGSSARAAWVADYCIIVAAAGDFLLAQESNGLRGNAGAGFRQGV